MKIANTLSEEDVITRIYPCKQDGIVAEVYFGFIPTSINLEMMLAIKPETENRFAQVYQPHNRLYLEVMQNLKNVDNNFILENYKQELPNGEYRMVVMVAASKTESIDGEEPEDLGESLRSRLKSEIIDMIRSLNLTDVEHPEILSKKMTPYLIKGSAQRAFDYFSKKE